MALANSVSTRSGFPGKGAVHDRIELQLGSIGHDRHHIVERDLAFAVGVERKLLQFVARGLAVAAEQRHQRRAGVRRDAQIRDPQFVVDQFRKLALRRRDSSRSRPRSWRARRPCAAAIPAAARRPRSRCGNPSAANPPAYRRRWQNCGSRRGRGSRGGRRTAASSWLHRPAATARPKARRHPASPAKTDRWDRRPRTPAARRRVRAPGPHRDRRAG